MMPEIIGYCAMVCGGWILVLLLLVGAVYATFWAASFFWDLLMWTDASNGYTWERVPCDGYKRRLWFFGIKVGRFGVGVMGTKLVEEKKPC